MEFLEFRRMLATTSISPVHEFNGAPLGPAIEGAESRLTRHDDGLTLTVNTSGLEPAAYTLWWVVFNNPEFCSGGCNGPDLRNPAVEGTVLYGTGQVVGDDGIGNFTAQLAEGDVSGVNAPQAGLPGSDNGLIDASKAEIHFVVRSHGPALEGDPLEEGSPVYNQTHTFNGGCATEGVEGFACFDPQAGIHLPPGLVPGDIDLNGVVDFADFLILSSNFGQRDATRAQGDLDGDGAVQFSDFLILSSNFGSQQPVAASATRQAAAAAKAAFDANVDDWWEDDDVLNLVAA